MEQRRVDIFKIARTSVFGVRLGKTKNGGIAVKNSPDIHHEAVNASFKLLLKNLLSNETAVSGEPATQIMVGA